jgi:hypothetical protein
MRITREKLLKYAETKVAQRVRQDRQLICVYLTGSLLLEDPMLGGSTDIDLVFVHTDQPVQSREVERVTDEITLDISHVSQSVFQQPRSLRSDPWLGSYLCESPINLYQTRHWFEFTQASVCAQFNQPNYVLQRARPLAESARQYWMDLQAEESKPLSWSVHYYLRTLEMSSNAVSCLTGPPLPERRFLLNFPIRAQSIHRPGLATGLIELLVKDPEFLEGDMSGWMLSWDETLQAASNNSGCPVHLWQCRRRYFTQGVDALWQKNPVAGLWLLLRTWTAAICVLPANSPQNKAWQEFCGQLGLSKSELPDRLVSLDQYLDAVEESIDLWAKDNGATE